MKSETDLSLLARQWGATAVPFGMVNTHDWMESPGAQKALAGLTQTAALRSVMLLCGPNGVGKSALAGRWMRSLDSRLYYPVCLTQATLSGTAILAALANKLGKPASFFRQRNLQLIEEALNELERRILVVILDEAQNYSQPSLEEVRLLLGLNLPEQPAFALVLIGDEYLLSSLKLRNQRALYSRLACQLSLAPWTSAQCAQYLSAALSAVGLSASAIEPAALELLASASAGLPRSLCLLARAAWIAAATEQAQKILAAHVQLAIQQVPCVPGLLPPAQSAES
ncbi:MAG TPA: ATP-binding protein [Candidatus Angelobacter sp.]|jgi:type II secretory pathway predicted ATPase ExeA|nr:ATP-binding protein [Candidatus Angelobacter sp.]